MQKKYRIKLSSLASDLTCFNTSEYSDTSISYARKKTEVEKEIKRYIDENDTLDAQKIMDMMFPQYTSHLFISHKSEHAYTAIQLANILYEKYGIISFIDSQVWHHIDMVKEMINNKVSKLSEEKGVTTYNHTRASIVASNVFAMLSASLFKAMDDSDGFIYIDSEESNTNEYEYINENNIDNLKTKSPWLFLETTYAGMLRKKMHQRPTERQLTEHLAKSRVGIEKYAIKQKIQFEYTTSIIDAINISSIGSALFIREENNHPLLFLDKVYAAFDEHEIF